jgi:hypothetical protein
MKNQKNLAGWLFSLSMTVAVWTGCHSAHTEAPASAAAKTETSPPAAAATPAPPASPTPRAPAEPQAPATSATPAVAPAPAASPASSASTPTPPVRIKAGVGTGFKDADGNEWLPDQNFIGGETIERPDIEIKNTKSPAIYRAERYSMTGFSCPVPNGKYIVKLHFCETFEGITAPGERVYSFNVEGQDFKDFDVFKTAGGALTAYVQTVPVEVKDGKLDITFTPNIENPEINGIEILPAQ